jgi:hypothetical protein
MYSSSAALVRYLAAKYNIPLDRAHIIGHDDVPGPTSSTQAGMHWDPGPFWDWARYMALLRAPSGSDARIVTLNVSPSSNTQTVKDCSSKRSTTITQGANFVYLRTAPSATASYITNPYLTSDPLCANNWANKAVSGQSFYRFDGTTYKDWDGIYFGGQKAWFYNPGHSTFTVPGSGTLVKPAGSTAISVYGRAYPEASAYPSGITPQTVSPITNYSIPAGQVYVAIGPFTSDYYYAPQYTPTLTGSANQDVPGQTQYYQIFYNHRFAFVQVGDVTVVP